jgi:hypothetical protein
MTPKNMKRIVFIFLLAICYFHSSTAQSPLWTSAYAIGAGDYDFCRGIGTDNSDNIYIGGLFSATVDFDPGPGVVYGAATGFIAYYIASYNDNGTLRWLRTMGGNGTSIDMDAFATDANGNVYVSGYFFGTLDFDGTAGTDIHSSAAGAFDIFLTKYDSAGNYQFTLTFPGTSFFNLGKSITTDAAGNIYLCGYFSGDVDFDPTAGQVQLYGAGFKDIFIAKYTSNGLLQWVKQIGNADDQTAFDMAVSASGSLYITGSFDGTLDFNPGSGVNNFISQGNSDIFILKLDNAGNYIWNKQIGNTDIDEGHKLTLGVNDEIYVTGFFGWTVDFDPGPAMSTLTSAGSDDIFILKIDTTGSFEWARSIGSGNLDEGIDIRTLANGDVCTYILFRDAADVDPGNGVNFFTPSGTGYSDLALVSLDSLGVYKWAEHIGGDCNEYGGKMALTSTGAIWVSGDFFSPTINLGIYVISNVDQFGGSNDIFFSRLGNSASQGISQTTNKYDLKIFPNPASTEISMKGIPAGSEVKIVLRDLTGKPIKEALFPNNELLSIPLSNISSGMYIMEIQMGNTLNQVKFVVQ